MRRKVTRTQVERARRLRQSSSVAESIFWNLARRNGLGFNIRRQHAIAGLVVVFYCHEARLAIEFDGEQHDPAEDARRDALLASLGIETMRIPNTSFFHLEGSDKPNVDWVNAIVRRLEERSGRKAFPDV